MFIRILLFAALSISCVAQESRGATSVKGVVIADGSLTGNHLVVDLIEYSTRKGSARTYVGSDGNFEFRDVPAGMYILTVGESSGDPMQQEIVDVGANAGPIEIRLTTRENKPHGGTGTVSVYQLQHPMSSKSKKIFEAAKKASAAGDYLKQIEILRRALPDAAAAPYARMNIGSAYIKAHQVSAAIPEFEEAVRLLPQNAVMHANFGYALLLTKRFDAAELECRRALELDRNNSRAHWLLGSILLNKGTHQDEAVEDLRFASRELPTAKVILAEFYERSGQKDAAVRELREFLPQASSEERVKVEQWLSKLDTK